jgi:uncharacterized protein DUF4157
MTPDREHAHAPSAADVALRDDDDAPGHSNRAARLTAPTRPLVSGLLRRKADGNGVTDGAEHAVAAAASTSAHALPEPVLHKFESSLGIDLSSVRVHTGAESQAAARAVGARAYTVGQDIHFAAGHYDPRSRAGEHLLAHEVAHTVQQRGGEPTRQNQLEVSNPTDSFEHDADRAAEAMVAGETFSVTAANPSVARDKDKGEVDAAADAGQLAMMKGDAQKDIVLQVSNATDVGDAQKALAMLEDNQQMLEKGAAMASTQQKGLTDWLHDKLHGESDKLQTQIPLQAISDNAALISDIQLYLVEGRGQSSGTSAFQDQYMALLAQYGRIESVVQKYAGMSLKTMAPGDAHGAVENAAGAGGNTTEDLHNTFKQLEKDPGVAAAQALVMSSTQEFEKMPETMSTNMKTAISSMQAFNADLVTATVAQTGLSSLQARNAFQAAKGKAEDARRFTDKAKDLLFSSAKDAAKTAAKAAVDAGGLALSNVGAIAAKGLASGGEAAAMDLANTLVIEPAKDAMKHALTSANAAVGIIEKDAQIDLNIDAEKQKQDSATIETAKAAGAAVHKSAATNDTAMEAWVKSALQFELKKADVKKYFTALQTAIKQAAGAKGKSKQGKALSEMLAFTQEAEQFVVQASAVLDTGKRGLGIGSKDEQDEIPARARAALAKIANRKAWMAHSYPFKNAHGEVETFYGAQQVNLKIIGPGLDAGAAELAGSGRADGFHNDPGENTQSANQAIPAVIPKVEAMRSKVLAVRNAIMADVFGP